jgi:hypothetical protein
MTNPITPPPELVGHWLCSDDFQWGPLEQISITITTNRLQHVATQAAQWGADQELEACCELVPGLTNYLCNTRRPKPPSLKEEAIGALHGIHDQGPTSEQVVIIRRALESLPE